MFVFLATEGSLNKANVRHGVACAVALGKRMLVLVDEEGMPVEDGNSEVPRG